MVPQSKASIAIWRPSSARFFVDIGFDLIFVGGELSGQFREQGRPVALAVDKPPRRRRRSRQSEKLAIVEAHDDDFVIDAGFGKSGDQLC